MAVDMSDNLIVTYHYVRPSNSDGVTGLTPATFREHLEAIRLTHEIVDADRFEAEHAGRRDLALITFDDAVRDQFDFAAPVLAELGAPATFFAPMRPFDPELAGQPAEQWITQHLLHALAEYLGWDELEQRVDQAVGAAGLSPAIDADQMNDLYHYELPRKRRLKYLLAFAFDATTAADLLGTVNAAVGLRATDWFMTPEQLVQLEHAGHMIGGHGYDHVPYTTLDPSAQREDLEKASALKTRLLGARPRPLAYPFGRWTPETPKIAREVGYTSCYDTAQRVDARVLLEELAARRARDSESMGAPA